MKKNLKVLATVAMITVVGGTALFAAPKVQALNDDIPEVVIMEPEYELTSISGEVKVSEKKGVRIVSLKLQSGRTYVLTNDLCAEEDALITMDDLAAKKGTKVRVAGYLNKSSGVFTVVKYGNLKPLDTANAK